MKLRVHLSRTMLLLFFYRQLSRKVRMAVSYLLFHAYRDLDITWEMFLPLVTKLTITVSNGDRF